VFQRTLVHIEQKFSRWFQQLKWINFGGGHLITRRDYDVELLVGMMRDFRRRYPHLKVILEPGSAFAWQTGPLVAQVVDIVEDRGIRTAILNVSFTCHMPDCLEMPYMPDVRGAETVEPSSVSVGTDVAPELAPAQLPSTTPHLYRLGGNSCLSGDFMGYWRFDRELRVGENVIFEDMIHYTTVKTCTFNGITHPGIALAHADGEMEILREFGYEDYKNRMD
jgi:carboxynorspermidine decarboxylase